MAQQYHQEVIYAIETNIKCLSLDKYFHIGYFYLDSKEYTEDMKEKVKENNLINGQTNCDNNKKSSNINNNNNKPEDPTLQQLKDMESCKKKKPDNVFFIRKSTNENSENKKVFKHLPSFLKFLAIIALEGKNNILSVEE